MYLLFNRYDFRWPVSFYATLLLPRTANIVIIFLQNWKIEIVQWRFARDHEVCFVLTFECLGPGPDTSYTEIPSNSFQNWLHPVVSGLRCISPNDYTSPCGMDGMGPSPNAECALQCLAAEDGCIIDIFYCRHLADSKSRCPHDITPTHDHAQHFKEINKNETQKPQPACQASSPRDGDTVLRCLYLYCTYGSHTMGPIVRHSMETQDLVPTLPYSTIHSTQGRCHRPRGSI